MLGNDLIDLQLAQVQSDWKRKGYLSKLFNDDEQRAIALAQDPGLLVWMMWSMKEAAYKVHNRNSGIRRYEPLAYSCMLEMNGVSTAQGAVMKGNESFPCRSSVYQGMLHTVALGRGAVFGEVKTVHMENQQDYRKAFGSQSGLVLAKCPKGLPMVYDPASGRTGPASVSHHGRGLCVVYLQGNEYRQPFFSPEKRPAKLLL